MKITMLDTVEASHTIFSEIEGVVSIEEQPGLTVQKRAEHEKNGLASVSFVLKLSKGATIDVPERLAKRQIDLGFATLAKGREISAGLRVARSKGEPG